MFVLPFCMSGRENKVPGTFGAATVTGPCKTCQVAQKRENLTGLSEAVPRPMGGFYFGDTSRETIR